MQQTVKKNSLNPRFKHRAIKPNPSPRVIPNWQDEDYKITQINLLSKCYCSICYKELNKIPGIITEKFPVKISIDKTKFLFNSLISKNHNKAMNVLIVDSCFYSQGRPERIFYSEKGLIVQSKSKQITQKYVFHRLVEQTKIQNTGDTHSLLSKTNPHQTTIPFVNARYCNHLIPKWSQFNQSNKSIFNVKVYRKGNAPQFNSKKSSDKTYSAIIHYKDHTMVLLSENNFDKLMKDRREGNPHITFIQSYVKPKFTSKKNYYGILLTNYNIKQKYNIKQGLYQSARLNIMKYLDKDPFAIDDVNQDNLSTQDLAIFYMYRIIEYLKQTQDILINTITLAWVYSINNELFLSYCSQLQYSYDNKIKLWEEPCYSRVRSKSKILAETISDQSSLLFEKWKQIKERHKQKSMQKVQKQRSLYTDNSQTVFNMMYPEGDFKTLNADSYRSARLSKTSSSFKTSWFNLSPNIKTKQKKPKWSIQKQSKTIPLFRDDM